MIRFTVLALFVVLCNASRLLLQAPPAQQTQQTPQAQPQTPQAYYNMGFTTGYEMGYAAGFNMGYNMGSQPPPQPQPQQQPQQQTPVAQPQTPQTPASPAPPAQPQPAVIQPPVQPQPANPVTPPANNQPQLLNPVQPSVPSPYIYTTPPPPISDINCGPTPPATQCANRRAGPGGSPLGPLTLTNLADNAKLYCDTPMACANSEINIELSPNSGLPSGVHAINQLLFSEAGSGQGSTVNIKNLQNNGNNVELSSVECGTQACNGLTINGWGVSLNDMNCALPNDCMDCNFNNYKTTADEFCPQPFGPGAVNNPGCLIETKPCYGY